MVCEAQKSPDTHLSTGFLDTTTTVCLTWSCLCPVLFFFRNSKTSKIFFKHFMAIFGLYFTASFMDAGFTGSNNEAAEIFI